MSNASAPLPSFTTRAGTPPTVAPLGTAPATVLPLKMHAPSPMVAPRRMVTRVPTVLPAWPCLNFDLTPTRYDRGAVKISVRDYEWADLVPCPMHTSRCAEIAAP